MGETEVGKKPPAKEEHTVRVSSEDSRLVRKIAEARELPIAEILSDAVKIGLPTLVEQQNRTAIYKRTSAKAELIDLLDSIPQGKLDEAIALLKGLNID